MRTWLRNLVAALSFGLALTRLDAQQYRVTELSSWPRRGIPDAKIEIYKDELKLVAYTDSQGFFDISQLTSVNEPNNPGNAGNASKLSKITASNGIMFSGLEQQAELTIYNVLGQLVYHATSSGGGGSGLGSNITWNMLNNHNNKVASGIYLYKLEDKSKIEYGKIIPGKNFVDVSKNRVIKEKIKQGIEDIVQEDGSRKSGLNKEGVGSSKEGVGNVVSNKGGVGGLDKGGVGTAGSNNDASQVIFRVSKDENFYMYEDTLQDMSKIPANTQLLENVDMGKSDGIRSLEYLKLFTNSATNYGPYETTYPIGVFLDSAAIFSNPVIQSWGPNSAPMYLVGLRKIMKEANDSIKIALYKEVDNSKDAKVRLDYSDPQGGSFVLTYYSYDKNGNPDIDSARIYIGNSFGNDSGALRTIAMHEFTHTHISEHSHYKDDVTSTDFANPNKTYSKGDEFLFRAVILGNAGTKWKKFLNYQR